MKFVSCNVLYYMEKTININNLYRVEYTPESNQFIYVNH